MPDDPEDALRADLIAIELAHHASLAGDDVGGKSARCMSCGEWHSGHAGHVVDLMLVRIRQHIDGLTREHRHAVQRHRVPSAEE